MGASLLAQENAFLLQQFLVTSIVIFGAIFGCIYLIHRINLENNAVSKEEKTSQKNEKKETKIPSSSAEERQKQKLNQLLAEYDSSVEKTKEEDKPKIIPMKKVGTEAAKKAAIFGDPKVIKYEVGDKSSESSELSEKIAEEDAMFETL